MGAEGSSLLVDSTRSPDGKLVIRLSGSIDENADVDGVFRQLSGDAVLNLRGIQRINSIGVHRWIPALRAAAAAHRIELEELSYPVVMQANYVFNLLASAHVRSFLAPYFCPRCQEPRTSTVTVDEMKAHGEGAPPRTCESCGSEMQFDDLDSYFKFLSYDHA